jgi:hypothetical protein
MAFYELYPIVMACVLWGYNWSRKRILFNCDNLATVEIVRKGRWWKAWCRVCMWCQGSKLPHLIMRNRVSYTIVYTWNMLSMNHKVIKGWMISEFSHEFHNAWNFGSTRLTYNSALRCFKTFLALNRLTSPGVCFPHIDEDCLIYFVTFCQKSLNLKHQSIKLYLTGIRHYYIRFRGYDPFEKAIRLPIIFRDIKKSQCNVTKERLPITSSILKELCTGLNTMFS